MAAKAKVQHGEFGEWVEKNCRVKQVQARKYMKLARDMPELITSNRQSTVDLGIEQAIALLTAPEEVKTEVTERIESGETVPVSKPYQNDINPR